MPANTAHGLPYPVGTDRVMDGDNAIRALAEAVDPVIRTTLPAQTGWGAPVDVRLVKIGALCYVHFSVTRTGADIAAPAGGNITDTHLAGPVPADMIPPDRVYGGSIQSSAHQGGGRINGVATGTSQGLLTMTSLNGNSTIATGSMVDYDQTYFLW